MWSPFRRFRRRRRRTKNTRLRRTIRWGLRIVMFLMILDFAYLWAIWPDWQQFRQGHIVKSRFIERYEQQRQDNKKLPTLHWHPVPLSWIPKHVRQAVLTAEDARFYQHSGVDVIAIKDAVDYNLEKGRIVYGASTLSQQTVKNMFFSASRNPLRKWHELVFTLAMEHKVGKNRILATYLNVAEFGQGIYGVEAAAKHYWGVSVYSLDRWQAAQLAATLPSPVWHNPANPTKRFLRRARRIYRRLRYHPEYVAPRIP